MDKRIETRSNEHAGALLGAGLHPVLQRVLQQRGVLSAEELDTSLQGLLPFTELSGISAAVALLISALQEQGSILIVGDYDADGATSTALAIRALRAMGFQRVAYLVPTRFEYGYGLSPEIVEVAKEFEPDLIITVDNGIASNEGVAVAQAAGIQVLITDHHLPGRQLPAAEAIVNPNLNDDGFASKSLAGVGVIFYVMLALRSELRQSGWFEQSAIPEPNLAQLLDLVALGTVADVVSLDRNNRILVSQGMARMRRGECNEGIKALSEVAGRELARLHTGDLGFALAPRLNAAGRMEDMSLGIACLLSDDPSRALELAQRLNELNLERREVEAQMQQEALAILAHLELAPETLPSALCLYDAQWHQGVIGILASRIKDRYYRPVIVFAETGEGELKGSARSIPGLHIRDALDRVASLYPGLITRFGGHAMAAGLSLATDALVPFEQALQQVVSDLLDESTLEQVLLTDGALAEQELSLELARELRYGCVWGQGFPAPSFVGDFELVSRRIVGSRHLKMQLRIAGGEQIFEAIAFNHTDAAWPASVKSVRAVYGLDENIYAGRHSLQLMVEYLQPLL